MKIFNFNKYPDTFFVHSLHVALSVSFAFLFEYYLDIWLDKYLTGHKKQHYKILILFITNFFVVLALFWIFHLTLGFGKGILG